MITVNFSWMVFSPFFLSFFKGDCLYGRLNNICATSFWISPLKWCPLIRLYCIVWCTIIPTDDFLVNTWNSKKWLDNTYSLLLACAPCYTSLLAWYVHWTLLFKIRDNLHCKIFKICNIFYLFMCELWNRVFSVRK